MLVESSSSEWMPEKEVWMIASPLNRMKMVPLFSPKETERLVCSQPAISLTAKLEQVQRRLGRLAARIG